jgi:hypothetical protein
MPLPHHCHTTAITIATATPLATTTATKVEGNIWVTGQWLAAGGEDGWWWRISLSLRMLIFFTADFGCGFFCLTA